MRICYLDESGVPELTGGTSHFVLLGLSIPDETWRAKDAEISLIKQRFGLEQAEVHTGWMARRFLEQERIPGFEGLGIADRRAAVNREKLAFLVKKATRLGEKSIREDRKNFKKTEPYIHPTLNERREVLRQIAQRVGAWDDCYLFGECTDKRTFGGRLPRHDGEAPHGTHADLPPTGDPMGRLASVCRDASLRGQWPDEHGSSRRCLCLRYSQVL